MTVLCQSRIFCGIAAFFCWTDRNVPVSLVVSLTGIEGGLHDWHDAHAKKPCRLSVRRIVWARRLGSSFPPPHPFIPPA